MTNLTTRLRACLLAAFLAVALLGAPAQARSLDVPGEGLGGSLLPETPEVTADAAEPAGVRLSPAEIEALGIAPADHQGGAATASAFVDTGDLPPLVVHLPAPRQAEPAAARRRRSLASRGAPAGVKPPPAEAPAPRAVDLTPIIVACARKYDLDPWLIRAVIEVESSFRPHAVSYAGAGGLMQLMPGTAAELGCADRFDPEQNIEAGSLYLRKMLDRFGRLDLAIAAYNAGPGNVARHGGIPPFQQTQRYVVKVKRALERKRTGSWGKG